MTRFALWTDQGEESEPEDPAWLGRQQGLRVGSDLGPLRGLSQKGPDSETAWVQTLTLAFTSWVTSGKCLNLPEPQFVLLYSGRSSHLPRRDDKGNNLRISPSVVPET